jgi:hypothetical protein
MPKRAAMGAATRIRPKFMTVATVLAGLIPVMWATGAGADVMKRIAAPMIGGILTSFALEKEIPGADALVRFSLKLKSRSYADCRHGKTVPARSNGAAAKAVDPCGVPGHGSNGRVGSTEA